MLAGNLAALGVGTIISVGSTLIWPDMTFSFASTPFADENTSGTPQLATDETDDEKKGGYVDVTTAAVPQLPTHAQTEDSVSLKRAFRFAVIFSLVLTLILIILIPLPLFFTSYVYSPAGFTGWVAVSFVWVFYAIGCVVLYPIFESRTALKEITSNIIKDFTGRGK